jgi:2-haloalkanoic acid dehalogenase type II
MVLNGDLWEAFLQRVEQLENACQGQVKPMKLSDFKMLSFDTYGTLIDWESGIYNGLGPLLDKLPLKLDRDEVLELFAQFETRQQADMPTQIYSALLADVSRAMAKKWQLKLTDEEASSFGRSVKHWPEFADSAQSLKYLRRHYRMATLTNCDRISYMGSNSRLEIEWDAIYTAQDIGCYKPSLRNFEYMFEHARRDLGILPHQILHVAQSLTHDMIPATSIGMTKVWINRRHASGGYGATAPPEGEFSNEWEFNSMADFVKAHQQELA